MAPPQADSLFEAPAAARQAHPLREGDRVLYRPPRQRSDRYSRTENIRVRALLQAHIEARVATHGTTWGRERRLFSEAWVALAAKLELRQPGNPKKVHHVNAEPRVDAGMTALRRFMEGADVPDWQLVGIESVICDREDRALPAAAYQYQRRLT